MPVNLSFLRTLREQLITEETQDEILARRRARFEALYPEWTYNRDDSLGILLHELAFLEYELQARYNGHYLNAFSVFAQGAALDIHAADKDVTRVEGEGDESLRVRYHSARGTLSPGSIPAILASAREASADVADVATVVQNDYRTVNVYIKSRGDPPAGQTAGTPTAALLAQVSAYINSDETLPPRRGYADIYTPLAPTVQTYTVTAVVHFDSDVEDGAVILGRARDSLQAFAQAGHAIGQGVPLDQLRKTLLVDGVDHTTITAPAADLARVETRFYHLDYAGSAITAMAL